MDTSDRPGPGASGPVPLRRLTVADLDRFGAKAVNLGRMTRWGLPVPAGFALALGSAESGDLDAAAREALAEAYIELGAEAGGEPGAEPAVAVRSSAVGEDGDEHSFAGQHDSFLDVRGLDAVVEAVRRCADSRHSQRATAYRSEAGAQLAGMGVVVQLMVPARFAGVCFTRSPNDDEQVLVELVDGLAEGLVSGTRRPAQARFDRDDLAARGDEDHDGMLSGFGLENARAVARLALKAERRFGAPQDVEWAFASGAVSLVQARPITTGAGDHELERIRQEEIQRLQEKCARRPVVWTDFSIADMLPEARPLTLQPLLRASSDRGGIARAYRRLGLRYRAAASGHPMFEVICGRPYVNVTECAHGPFSDFPVTVDTTPFTDPDAEVDPLSDPPLRFDWSRWWLVPLWPLWLLRYVLLVPLMLLPLRRGYGRRYVEQIRPALVEEAAQERQVDLSELSMSALANRLSACMERVSGELIYYHELTDAFALVSQKMLELSLRALYGAESGEVMARLTTALPHNFNTESNLDLARVAAGDMELTQFLERYGHRGNPDWDLSAPRWREDPRPVERMVQAVGRSTDDPLERFQQQVRVREQAEERLAVDIKRRWWLRWLRPLVFKELRYYQQYSPMREISQSVCYMWVELARRVLLEAARRLETGDLLFHLSTEEVLEVMRGADPAAALERARLRRRRAKLARRVYLPHCLVSTDLSAIGRPPRVDPDQRQLRGLGVSGGVVRGPARVVSGLEEAQDLQQGEILVARHTDPAWTPLFLIAGGLVLEQGGMLSHGAIVAREHGLPAVINVPHVTRLVRTGQQLTLDAAGGRVILQPRSDEPAADQRTDNG